MKIPHLHTGSDGESHFGEIEVELKPHRGSEISSLQEGTGVVFRHTPPGYVLDWHPAPKRQYIITLQGEVEIEVGDGTKRRFGPGDIMLADDLTGRGHVSRVVSDGPRLYVQIPVK